MQQIGDISNLISKKTSKPKPTPPSRIEQLEDRVATLESTLNKVLSELTALREAVQRKPETSRTDAPQGTVPRPSETAKPPPKENTATPTQTSAKRAAKPPATETETKPPPPKKGSKRPRSVPWDDPEIKSELEACRPRILELLGEEKQITKQGCADALGIDPALAGRTLSYMMTQTNEVRMISPPKTEDDPDPKKIFRRIT